MFWLVRNHVGSRVCVNGAIGVNPHAGDTVIANDVAANIREIDHCDIVDDAIRVVDCDRVYHHSYYYCCVGISIVGSCFCHCGVLWVVNWVGVGYTIYFY